MTVYGKKANYFTKSFASKPRRASRSTIAPAGKTFATSPAGKHRALALNAFALATKARAAGNTRHYWRMVSFGKKALALSKSEIRMWKQGKALRAKSYAAHKAVRATAAYQ